MTTNAKKRIAIFPVILALIAVLLSVALKHLAFEGYGRLADGKMITAACDPEEPRDLKAVDRWDQTQTI